MVDKFARPKTAGNGLASIRISNGSPLVYEDYYTKLHIVVSNGPVSTVTKCRPALGRHCGQNRDRY